jgi:ketosteroid isomerase-like protein
VDNEDPAEVLRRWFAAHAAGDLGAARQLIAPDAAVQVPGELLSGFDGLMSWYAERRQAMGEGFGYELVDLLSGRHHVAAVLALTDGTQSWQQVALYRVEGGVITAITAYEDARTA